MAPTDGLRTRTLTAADAEAGYSLSSEAGWNQTIEDWQMMLAAAPAIGQIDEKGALAATALVMPYDRRIGWIAMVLTTVGHRRRGLATANLRWAIEICDRCQLIAGLDATPEGRDVYRPLGFHDLWPLQRWVRVRATPAGRVSLTACVIRSVVGGDLDGLAARDGQVFGARRTEMLSYLHQNQPRRAWLAKNGGTTVGFVLARAGRRALHIGPLLAPDETVAAVLLQRVLAGVEGTASIDVPDHQAAFHRRLRALGFTPARPFMRMIREVPAPAEKPEESFAIAGPELG